MKNVISVYDRIKHLELGMQRIPDDVMSEGVPLGYLYNPFLREERKIYLDYEQLAKHNFMSGETGSGKTSFFYTMAKNMIDELIEKPEEASGFCYIDPVYNGANGLLTYIYKLVKEGKSIDLSKIHYLKYTSAKALKEIEVLEPHYEGDVLLGERKVKKSVIENLYECEHVPGHNLLEFDPVHDDVMATVEKVMAIIDVALPSGSGGAVRMQKYIRNALGPLLLDKESRSVVDVLRFVKDENFRSSVLCNVDKNKGHSYLEFWESSDGDIPKETLDAIETRFDGLTGSIDMRRIFGQKEESLEFTKYMDEGHVVLIDLGHIEYNGLKKMIASHVVYNFYMDAKNKRSNKRRRFVVFVDELTQAEVDVIAAIVADGRQFGFVFFPMTQEITQLKKETQAALKRVANFFVLRQSSEGATIMSKIVDGVFQKKYIRKLETGIVALYTKATIKGKEKTFTCLIKADPPFIYDQNCQIVDYKDGVADLEARKFAFKWAKDNLISKEFKRIDVIDKIFFQDRGIAMPGVTTKVKKQDKKNGVIVEQNERVVNEENIVSTVDQQRKVSGVAPTKEKTIVENDLEQKIGDEDVAFKPKRKSEDFLEF